jgi:hypothetical protein
MSEAVIEAIKSYEEHHEQWIAAYHEWKNALWTPDHPKDYESDKGVKFPAELANIIHAITKAENTDRINRLVAKGFTRDGILVASIGCESIGYAVSRAEQIAEGDWK